MTTFVKVLQHAERERALKRQPGSTEPTPPDAEPPPPETSLTHSSAAPLPMASRLPAEGISRPEPAVVADRSQEVAGMDDHLVSLLAPTSPEAEQYQVLRHTVEQLHQATKLSVVAVSSPSTGDGKTITAINLAGSLAQALETRVLLVDADLRRPSVADYLFPEASNEHGLANAILDPGLSLADATRKRPPFGFAVLPAGRPSAAPYGLLKSPRFERLLEEARRHYDYIVVDTPPLVPLLDCRVLEKCVDGFLVVVRAHQTSRRLLAEAIKVLEPAKVLGLVFNADDEPRVGYGYEAYGHRRRQSTTSGRS